MDDTVAEIKKMLSSKKRSGEGKIIVFAGSAISMRSPSCLPLAIPMVKATIEVLLQNNMRGEIIPTVSLPDKLKDDWLSKDHKDSKHPGWDILRPEMIYDAIYESAGNKVFNALDCLKFNRPNINHKILAALLEQGFIDHIITTNFDRLIEQSMSQQSLNSSSSPNTRLWKIHGDILRPNTIATTIRRIGQAAFDENLVNRLKELLEGSHVLFIGYGGTDPDLMPAFMTANMKSVYWCVRNKEDIDEKVDKSPWYEIKKNKISIKWVVADLEKDEFLVRIAKELNIVSTSLPTENKDFKGYGSPLEKSIYKWERSFFRRLSRVEKARAILQILYDIGLYSSESVDAWVLLIETANMMAEDTGLPNKNYSEFRRDLHAFQAEAYLKIGEFMGELNKTKLLASLNVDNRHDLDASQAEVYSKLSKSLRLQLDDTMKKLRRSSLKIDGSTPEDQIGQLYIHAKNHLTSILPFQFEDAVQVQALLNASTILTSLADTRSEENERRNLQGAKEALEKGIRICNSARMNLDKRDLLEARCCSNLAVLYVGQGNPEEASRLFGKAERLFKKAGDLYSYIVTCIDLGLLYKDIYSESKKEIVIREAWKYYNSANDTLGSFPNNSLSDKAEDLKRELQEL